MNPLWWIVIAAGLVLAGALVLDALDRRRKRDRCWWCGARSGGPHRRGCRTEMLQ